jgi:hypothetical protein
MSKNKLTGEELVKKYKNKYIRTIQTYNYVTKQWEYEVVGVKTKIHEEYNLPEDIVTWGI